MEIIEALQNIGFDWRVALANFINFIIIFYLLKRFAFGPISKVLENREVVIKEGIENAQKAERDMVMAKEERRRVVDEAHLEANKIIMNGSEKAKQIITDGEVQAQKKAEAIRQKGEIDVEKERQKQEKILEEKSAEVVILGLEKILREEFGAQKQEEFIKKLAR